LRLTITDMNNPSQERPGRQHDRAASNSLTIAADYRDDAPIATGL